MKTSDLKRECIVTFCFYVCKTWIQTQNLFLCQETLIKNYAAPFSFDVFYYFIKSESGDVKKDLGHILDFITRCKYLKVIFFFNYLEI